MAGMEALTLLPLALLLAKILDFVKYARARDVNGAVTQLVAWAGGVALVFVAANADLGANMDVAGQTLGTLNAWSLVLVGLSLASTGSALVDVKKAVDNTDSAAVPALVSAPGLHVPGS